MVSAIFYSCNYVRIPAPIISQCFNCNYFSIRSNSFKHSISCNYSGNMRAMPNIIHWIRTIIIKIITSNYFVTYRRICIIITSNFCYVKTCIIYIFIRYKFNKDSIIRQFSAPKFKAFSSSGISSN